MSSPVGECVEDRCESRIRELGWVGVGALLGLVGSLIEGAGLEDPNSALPSPGPVAAWAVDRDAQEVCGLDEDLVLARSVRLGWPLAVRSRRDGGAWVLRSSLGSPSSPCRLARIRADGSIAVEIDLGRCKVLALRESGEALVVESGTGCEGADRLLCCDD